MREVELAAEALTSKLTARKRGTRPVWRVLEEFDSTSIVDVAVDVLVSTLARTKTQTNGCVLTWVLADVGRRLCELTETTPSSTKTNAFYVKMAAPVVDALEIAGIVTTETYRGSNNGKAHTYKMLRVNAEVEIAALFARKPLQHLVPQRQRPTHWTGVKGGPDGQLKLIRKATPSALMVAANVDQMPEVYKAINAMQDTPFRVNQRILDVLTELESAGVYGVVPEPVEPVTEDMSHGEKAELMARRSKRDRYDRNISVANKIATGSHYHYWTCCYRGRFYPTTIFGPNPQGDDVQRSLLLCSNPKVMGRGAAKWLKIHTANCYGKDKELLDGRVEWVEKNTDFIIGIANDPVGTYEQWNYCDKPLSFLAACFEYKDYLADPNNYRCPIFVQLDATLSCLQFLSALTGDAVAANDCNLTADNESIGDFYMLVVNALRRDRNNLILRYTKNIWEDGKRTGESVDVVSDYFAQFDSSGQQGLSLKDWRLIGKAIVMPAVYSSGPKTVARKIVEDLKKKGGTYANDVTKREAEELAKTAFDVMRVEAAGPWSVLDTLMAIGKQAKNGLSWRTPTGFAVDVKPKTVVKSRVNVPMRRTRKVIVAEQSSKISTAKVSQAVTANLIHSLDAALVARVVCRMKENGCNSFSFIHDSLGVPPQHCDTLFRIAREEFIKVIDEASLPTLINHLTSQLPDGGKEDSPSVVYGDFDVTECLQSDYMFS